MNIPVYKTRAFVFLLMLLAGLGLNGCSSSPSETVLLKEPEVQLVDVELDHARLLEQQFTLRFRVDNPDDVELQVRGLNYTVFLDKLKLASGQYPTWLTVPPHGHADLEVPVQTNLWRHMKDIAKLLRKSDAPVRYRLTGELLVGLMFGHNVNVSREGVFVPGAFIPE